MKASLKFREDQRPLARAKIPISVLGLPFLAGAVAGEQSDLRIELTTAFECGPAFRVSYRPHDPFNTFALSVKTGIGAFGSPLSGPMSMTSEFNLLAPRGGAGSPSFSVVFKPRLGDFCFKKSASSSPPRKIVAVADSDSDEKKFSPVDLNGIHPCGNPNRCPIDFTTTQGGLGGFLSSVEVNAKSILPLRRSTALRFRWGLRVPPELHSSSVDKISIAKLPMLVMSKIAIEYVPAAAKTKLLQDVNPSAASSGQMAEESKSLKLELAALQTESRALWKAVDDLRQKVGGRTSVAAPVEKISPAVLDKGNGVGDAAKSGPRATETTKRERRNELKSAQEDVNEELKRALMNATGGGK
ncbi:hypothetical protein HPP92_019677 [Vanilla planifolia]|uniref:Uncharacterized protein n=1 Tax=Vanilla planifolia TaxID=51239 RepID=A0A835Q6X9_VANPL|nr:hypothetical protein HPP92_019677 [Vanilla planifolia]